MSKGWAALGGQLSVAPESRAAFHTALIRKQGSSLLLHPSPSALSPQPSAGLPSWPCAWEGQEEPNRVTSIQLGAEHVSGMTPRKEGYFNLESCRLQLPAPK